MLSWQTLAINVSAKVWTPLGLCDRRSGPKNPQTIYIYKYLLGSYILVKQIKWTRRQQLPRVYI